MDRSIQWTFSRHWMAEEGCLSHIAGLQTFSFNSFLMLWFSKYTISQSLCQLWSYEWESLPGMAWHGMAKLPTVIRKEKLITLYHFQHIAGRWTHASPNIVVCIDNFFLLFFREFQHHTVSPLKFKRHLLVISQTWTTSFLFMYHAEH